MEMAPRIRKVQVTNNNGAINFGKQGYFAPFSATKKYTGSGGNSKGAIINRRPTGDSTWAG